MKDRIIVVGGYGQVGKVICEELGKAYPRKVYTAGRNLQKAEQFSNHMEGNVLPLRLDVSERIPDGFFQDVALVVMCFNLQHTDFVQACVQHHVDYIDVTADFSIMASIQEIHPVDSTVVLSVGLAPGISNMLVKQGKDRLDQVDAAHIYVLLGLGEAHGRAAIEWTVDNLNTSYSVIEQGSAKQVRSFTDGKKVDFPVGPGQKMAYRFNFSDQHVLPRTLEIPSVSTRLCFDSGLLTAMLAGITRIGIVRWLLHPALREVVVALFEKLKWGSEVYALKADVTGTYNGRPVRYQGSVHGEQEFYVTGRVAAFVAKEIYTRKFPIGVYHMEELFDPSGLFADLEGVVTFEEDLSY